MDSSSKGKIPDKNRRFQYYTPKYSKEFWFITASKKSDKHAFCKVCRRDLSIAHGGRCDILHHIKTVIHKRTIESLNPSSQSSVSSSSTMQRTEAISTTKAQLNTTKAQLLLTPAYGQPCFPGSPPPNYRIPVAAADASVNMGQILLHAASSEDAKKFKPGQKVTVMSATARPFKVWTGNRKVKKSITASSLQELIEKGKSKLSLNDTSDLRLVLEEDGTEVDDEEYFNFLPNNSTLLFLIDSEQWMPQSKMDTGHDETDYGVGDHSLDETVAAVAQDLRQDLSRIITLSSEQLQLLVDCETSALAHKLGQSERYTESVQAACQRHLDERSQTREAVDLLKLYHTARQASSQSKDNIGKKRKTEENS